MDRIIPKIDKLCSTIVKISYTRVITFTESVVFLIANGADLEQKVAGKVLKDYLRSKLPNIDPDAISIVKPNYAR